MNFVYRWKKVFRNLSREFARIGYYLEEIKAKPFLALSFILLFAILVVFKLGDMAREMLIGVISGVILSFFIDFIPKSRKKMESLQAIYLEISAFRSYLFSLKEKFNEEMIKMQKITNFKNKFFEILDKSKVSDSTCTQKMRVLKNFSTSRSRKEEDFCNLGEVLQFDLERATKKLNQLQETATFYGLATIEPEAMKALKNMVDKVPFVQIKVPSEKGVKPLIELTSNSAGLYGSDFDQIECDLILLERLIFSGRMHCISLAKNPYKSFLSPSLMMLIVFGSVAIMVSYHLDVFQLLKNSIELSC